MPSILIIGASGGIAKFVLSKLLALTPPPSIRVSSRDPSKASFPSSVEVVKADPSDPSSFSSLFTGVEKAFIYRQGAEQTYPALINSAKQAGVRHLVFVSSATVVEFPSMPISQSTKAMEDAFIASGLTYTLLRPGAFSSNTFFYFAPQLKMNGKVRTPYLNSESRPMAPEDIADVAVVALTTNRLDNQAPLLSGPQSLSIKDQLDILDKVSKEAGGKGVPYEEVSPEQWREHASKNFPPFVVDMLLGLWKATDGVKQHVSDNKEKITGIPPLSFEAWARKYAVL